MYKLFPYSCCAIELQGDGFDDPNRLFFSIEKALKSSLRIKSDLREMIPELFSIPEIYINLNIIFINPTFFLSFYFF